MGKVLSFISVLLLVNPCFGAAIPRLLSGDVNITDPSFLSSSTPSDTISKSNFNYPDPLIDAEGLSFHANANLIHSSKANGTTSIGINSSTSTPTTTNQATPEPHYWNTSSLEPENFPLFSDHAMKNVADRERNFKSHESSFENITENLGQSDSVRRSKRAALAFLGDRTCENRTYPTIQVNTGTYVRILSPNFPYHYPNKMKCGWKLVAEEGLKIRMLCPVFELARGDVVYYKDITLGYTLTYDQELPMQNVTSVTNQIFIGLSTDDAYTATGFRCFVRSFGNFNPTTEPTLTVRTPDDDIPILVRRVGEPLGPRRYISVIGSSQDISPTSSQVSSRTSSPVLPPESVSRIPSQTFRTPPLVAETSAISTKSLFPSESAHKLLHAASFAQDFTPPLPTSTSIVQILTPSYNGSENQTLSPDLTITSVSSTSAHEGNAQLFTSASSASTIPTTASSPPIYDRDLNKFPASTFSLPIPPFSDVVSATMGLDQVNDTVTPVEDSTTVSSEMDSSGTKTVKSTLTSSSLYPVYDSSKNAYEAYAPYFLRNLSTNYAGKPAIISAPYSVVRGITTYTIRKKE